MAVTETVDIEAPVGTVWALLDHPKKAEQWVPSMVEVRMLEEGADPVGSRFVHHLKPGGYDVEYEGEVTAWYELERVKVRAGNSKFSIDVDIRLEPHCNGTRVLCECEPVKQGMLGRLLSPAISLAIGRYLDQYTTALKQAAET